MRVSILGAGNWGTTLALMFQAKSHVITLWEYDTEQAEAIARSRRNEKFLPGYVIPNAIRVTANLTRALDDAEVVILAIPAQTCRSVVRLIGSISSDGIIVSVIKGLEQGTGKRISDICGEELRDFETRQYCVLSGPTIATEIAAGLPSSAVVASDCHVSAEIIQREFSSATLRLYSSDDVTGVEMAGALKNVIALAAGICDGMKLGFNSKGALLTRGLAEIARLGETMGGKRQTFSGLSGIGDLITTCTSPHSRNRTVGERIGSGEKLKDVLGSMVMVAEGVWTARAASELAAKTGIEIPIIDAVCKILFEETPPHVALGQLMARDLKVED
jgi:glycerol-3-phosphate dehydrogenase (NAD(P)+)